MGRQRIKQLIEQGKDFAETIVVIEPLNIVATNQDSENFNSHVAICTL